MKRNFVALLAASALASPGIAFAQNAAPAAEPTEEQGGLEEIIVTAQKRAEGLSDVPISI
jgi:iron complex outermembrane recepter protein